MDDLGFNKIAGAVLAVALGMLVLTKLPGVVLGSEGEEIVYKVGAIDTGTGTEAPVDLPFPQADWVAAMDDTKGTKVFKKCQSCHNNAVGGANGTGPNLYGVVDNDVGTHPGFKYSAAMLAQPGKWTYEELDDFLKKPSAHTPGTKMNFVGLKKPADRAAVIEHLRLADTNVSPRPVAKPAVAEGEEEGEEEGDDTAMEASAEDGDAATENATPGDAAAEDKPMEASGAEETATESGGEDSPMESNDTAAESEDTAADAEDMAKDVKDTMMDKAMDAKDSAMDAGADMKDSAEEMMENAAEKIEKPDVETPANPDADPTE